jgi:hypothetical protein
LKKAASSQNERNNMSDLSKVKTKLMEYTPAMATKDLNFTQKEIDAGHFRQRSISQMTVDRYARDIRNGLWAANPQTISFDDKGRIIDGRHRLMAIVLAGSPVILNVSKGWPSTQQCSKLNLNTIDVIDRGRGRSIGSQLTIGHGLSNGVYLAALSKAIAEITCDVSSLSISVAQALLILEIYKPSCEIIFKLSGQHRPGSYITAPLAFCHAADPAKVEEFAIRFFGMEGLKRGHPAHTLAIWMRNHPHARSQMRTDACKVVLSCLQKFFNAQDLHKVYASQDAWKWAVSQQKENVRAVREIMGVK